MHGSGAGNIWAVLLSVSRPPWRADGGDRKACTTPANCTQERHHTHPSCPHSKYTVFIRQHIMPVMQHWEVVYFKHMELRCQVKVVGYRQKILFEVILYCSRATHAISIVCCCHANNEMIFLYHRLHLQGGLFKGLPFLLGVLPVLLALAVSLFIRERDNLLVRRHPSDFSPRSRTSSSLSDPSP